MSLQSRSDLLGFVAYRIHRTGKKLHCLPNSPLEPSLRGAERGRPGTSIICVGDGFPPLTGDGPKEPSLLKGPTSRNKKAMYFSTMYQSLFLFFFLKNKII